jgi:PRTRC genetic system protein A
MHILAPHISCVVAPHEFAEAVAQGYKEIFIITVKGTYKHHILRGTNRYICLKVDSIPGYEEVVVDEAVNFLPAGKIPYAIYDQVLAFFRKVMEVKTAELEAMIHVLWNPEQGYHLGVPPQTISKASVNYDWSYIPSGTSIIVDIHSHNTMPAFFSGTDDRDDKGNISFSGVFGKLKDKDPMTVWRFNYFDKKYTAKVSDMFEEPALPETEVPQEWLEQIKVQTYSAPYGGYGGYQGRPLTTHGQGGHSNRGNVVGQHQRPLGTTNPSTHHTGSQTQSLNQPGKWRYSPENQADGAAKSPVVEPLANGYVPALDFDDSLSSTFFGNRDNEYAGMRYCPSRGHWVPKDDFDLNEDDLVDLSEGTLLGKPEGEPVNSGEDEPNGNLLPDDPAYEAIASVHGIEVADAWWSIGSEMTALEDAPELIAELVGDMVGLGTEEQQYKLISALFDKLSEANQEKIQTHGFA